MVGLFRIKTSEILKHWLFVGLSEELWFRGYILTKLKQIFSGKGKRRSIAASMVVSSIIFALIHIPQRVVVERVYWVSRVVPK